jgi:DNA-directed RNA polymerase specialized sigma24 family protein
MTLANPVVVQTQSPGAVQFLWRALERNADWIKTYTSISGSVLKEYLKWFFERLKDRLPPQPSEQDLDHLVRAEVKSIYSEFRDRPSGFPYLGDYADTSGDRFRQDLERSDEARECLEQLPKQIRMLLEDVYSFDEEEITRDELARRLGIKRNTLDQRICRAIKAIRLRVKR